MLTIKRLYLTLFTLLFATTSAFALPGDITTVAGGFNTDGLPATEAYFKTPYQIAVNWRGDVYISDLAENRVRKIDNETGIITTVAGNGIRDYAGDGGPATEASLASPRGIWLNGDDLYIADTASGRIRKVTHDGIINTVAGNGAYGYDGDGGPATNAMLAFPEAVYVDSDNHIYIADTINHVIRMVDANGIITTIAGNGQMAIGAPTDGVSPLETSLKFPRDVYKDGTGHLYIVDSDNRRVRKIDAFDNTITTIAGNGSFRASGDGGPAVDAGFWAPTSICLDIFRNIYVADPPSGQIRIITSDGTINTFAGIGQSGFSGDGGPATDATLYRPTDIASDDSGNIYIADESNGRIRKVTHDGTITTIAGGNLGDGQLATQANFYNPADVHVTPSGELYIADYQHSRIRKVDTSGLITTLAGIGQPGENFLGQPATLGTFPNPSSVAVDRDNTLYLSTLSTQIYTVDTQGIASAFAGNGQFGFSGDGGQATNANLTTPNGIFIIPDGTVFFADGENHRIRMISPDGVITTVVGNGTAGYSGDGGPAADVSLNQPRDVFIGPDRKLYIADESNHVVRMVDRNGTITTVAGNGQLGAHGDGGLATEASLSYPRSIYVDADCKIFIADRNNHRIRMVDTHGVITTIAGNGQAGYGGDNGPAASATLNTPEGLWADAAGNLYIADAHNHRVRMIEGIATPYDLELSENSSSDSGQNDPTTSTPQDIAPQSNTPQDMGPSGSENKNRETQQNSGAQNTFANDIQNLNPGDITTIAGGDASELPEHDLLQSPTDVFGHVSDLVYINDMLNSRIVTRSTDGTITVVAGNPEAFDLGDGGPATLASVSFPFSISQDRQGSLYIGQIHEGRIRRVSPDGIISTYAGIGQPGDSGEGGPAIQASLAGPAGLTSDDTGTLYFIERTTHSVRKITPDGIVTTVAGNGQPGFSGDGGPATQAQLNFPLDTFVTDNGEIIIVDEGNHRIRKIDVNGTITTIAGNGIAEYSGDNGPAIFAGLNTPKGVDVDHLGNIYVADSSNNRIRKINTNGIISTVVGTGMPEFSGDGGPAIRAALHNPNDVYVDRDGNLLIADTNNQRIRLVKSIATQTDQNNDPQVQPAFSLTADLDNAEGDQEMLSRSDVQPESMVYIQLYGRNIGNAVGFAVRFEYDSSELSFEGFDPDGVLVGGFSPGVEHGAGYIEITAATLGNTIAQERGLMGLVRFRANADFATTTVQMTNAQLRRNGQFESDDTPIILELDATPCPDVSGDGRVGFEDFLPFAEAFGNSRGSDRYDARYDFDGDGTIGFGDFLILSQVFGTEVDCAHGHPAGKSVVTMGANTDAKIQLVSLGQSQKDQLKVSVRVRDASQVKGYHLDLDYDANALELIKVEGHKGSAFGTPLVQNITGHTTVADVLASNATLDKQGELATLTFRVLSPTYTLDLSQGVLADHNGLLNTLPGTQMRTQQNFSLEQNSPNPFNPATQIGYVLPTAGEVSLVVYNLLGQEVRTLDSGYRASGHYQVSWDGKDALGRSVSSGVYIYRLIGNNQVKTKRMMLLK